MIRSVFTRSRHTPTSEIAVTAAVATRIGTRYRRLNPASRSIHPRIRPSPAEPVGDDRRAVPRNGPDTQEDRDRNQRDDEVRGQAQGGGVPELGDHGDVGDGQAGEPDDRGSRRDEDREARLLEHAPDGRESLLAEPKPLVVGRQHVDVLGEADGEQQARDDSRQDGHRNAEDRHETHGPDDADGRGQDRDHDALKGAEAQEQDDHEHGEAQRGCDAQVVPEVLDVCRLGQRDADLERRHPRRRVLAEESVDPVDQALVEAAVPGGRGRRRDVDGERGGPGVGRHEVADDHPAVERVAADARQVLGRRRHGRRDQRLGVERVVPALDVLDGREAVDSADTLDTLQRVAEATHDLEDGRGEHVVGLDQHDREVVAPEALLHLLVEPAGGVVLDHQPFRRLVDLQPGYLESQRHRHQRQQAAREEGIVDEPGRETLHRVSSASLKKLSLSPTLNRRLSTSRIVFVPFCTSCISTSSTRQASAMTRTGFRRISTFCSFPCLS